MLAVKCSDKVRNANGVIQAYIIKDKRGNTRKFDPIALKNLILNGELVVENLKLTKDYRLIDKSEEQHEKQLSKMDKLKLYESKQKLTGMIFDFQIDRKYGEIYISKYYDTPNRKEVIIPDFVDGFECTTGNSPFNECKYIEKIIAHSNIKGSLMYLFHAFMGEKLDLTEFDTSNIKFMQYTFLECSAKSILLGDKFKTDNVINMEGMFNRCAVEKLDLQHFNTTKVTNMSNMLSYCNAEIINFGGNFDTSNVINMEHMFFKCSVKSLNIRNVFNTSKVKKMEYMFGYINVDKLILGNKFDTSNVDNMSHMFFCSKIMSLDLGDNFDTSKVCCMGDMFRDSEITVVDLKKKFVITKENYEIDNIFSNCKTNKIRISQPDTSNTVKKLRAKQCKIPIESY